MTLMEQLKALAQGLEGEQDGSKLLSMLRTDAEDLLEFEDRVILGGRLTATLMGQQMALRGMIQTILTIGYNMRIAHEKEDAKSNADDRERI
jgi:hypothetical protein